MKNKIYESHWNEIAREIAEIKEYFITESFKKALKDTNEICELLKK